MTNPTSNYGFVMPTATDLVTDLPADFEVFGQAVDTQMKTNANAATQKATLTTTGDIYYASGANTPARLGIGSTSQVLTVSGGLPVWANSPAYEPVLTQETATYYIRNSQSGTQAQLTPTTSTTYYIPVFLTTFTADRIGFRAATYTTTGNVRLGLYNVSSTTGKPTTLVFDAGTVSVTAAPTDYTITISQSITAGWYYFAINRQSGSFTFTAWDGPVMNFASTASTPGGSTITMFTEASITGAFTTAGTVTPSAGNAISVGLRVA